MSPPLPPPPPPLSERAAKWLFIVACLAWAVLQTHGQMIETPPSAQPSSASTSLMPDVVNIEAQVVSRVDLSFDPKRPIGPDNPWVSRQRRPPCKPELETELFGLCWLPHGGPLGPSRTHCPPGTMTYAGNCYFPSTERRNGVADPLPIPDEGGLR